MTVYRGGLVHMAGNVAAMEVSGLLGTRPLSVPWWALVAALLLAGWLLPERKQDRDRPDE